MREIVIIAATFFGYEQVRHLTRNDTDAAFANARRVVDVEQTLHVFDEHRLQNLALHLDGLIQFLNHYYVFVHFPARLRVRRLDGAPPSRPLLQVP